MTHKDFIDQASKDAKETLLKMLFLEEIKSRLTEAKTALLMVDFDYETRKGFISTDTMRQVQRALDLIK